MFSNTKKASAAYDLLKNQNWVGLQKLMGNSSWPPNRGFISTSDKLLSPGTLFDRYGEARTRSTGYDLRRRRVSASNEAFEGTHTLK